MTTTVEPRRGAAPAPVETAFAELLAQVLRIDEVPADSHFFDALGADLMSVSGHKFGAPLGTGALLVRRGLRLRALLLGSDQERARRAGLENVPALVGFGAARAALTLARTMASVSP